MPLENRANIFLFNLKYWSLVFINTLFLYILITVQSMHFFILKVKCAFSLCDYMATKGKVIVYYRGLTFKYCHVVQLQEVLQSDLVAS